MSKYPELEKLLNQRFILVLGPNDPYPLLTEAMVRIGRMGKHSFAPEWMSDHDRVAMTAAKADEVIAVVLNGIEDPDTTKNIQNAMSLGKRVTRWFYERKFKGSAKNMQYNFVRAERVPVS